MNGESRRTTGRAFVAAIAAITLAAGLTIASFASAEGVAERPARLLPTRIFSIGDSLSVAFDSNFILENPSESWVNGYFGFFEGLFGLEDVNSHHQRIEAAFGGVGLNGVGAVAGADMDDMVGQAQQAVAADPYYVTVALGGNDVCADDFSLATPILDYALQFIDGVLVLDPGLAGVGGGLTPGSTVYVTAVVDVKQLYDVGKDATGLFGLDCETIWLTSLIGFPCATVVSPFGTEETRAYAQLLAFAYNSLLELVVDAVEPLSMLYWDFTWAPFNIQGTTADISSIDCFHLSSAGQRKMSEATWADGPFSAF